MFTGSTAWRILAAHIIGWELTCPPGQTYSEEADRWIERNPILTRVLILLLAAHVSNCIPNRFDPIHQFAQLIKR